ncbi:STAS/SEC14 domain-containing protein [Arenibacter sp. 6A1]|uniref:STAS/SEC14 domain-containing protein n=1 Tax=Arenibacter sp. 6A1 TaxID=2720391 RepID=UPI001445D6FE|nr:STAS/SEC14 domain-containing protein [Arenibacter sp. 6A1]NKI28329.1 STAS/SEC14 domain-containing protein [Arenibacter sp. 6A1]
MNSGQSKNGLVVKEYMLESGLVKVYNDYVISIFNEGTTITLERLLQLLRIMEIHYENKNFGYISIRKNSYAIDPMIYSYLRELDCLKAFAIVSVKEIDMYNFNIEKLFYKKPMKFFIDQENALTWVKRRIRS